MKSTRLTELLNITYPVIQGGMVWVSGGRLAAAVSEAGGLGVIGAGSMNLELLEHHIKKAQNLTKKPLAINVPLLYQDSKKQLQLALDLGIRIFITSAGSPKKYTDYLKNYGAIVGHVTSTPQLAKKCEDAGVDFIVVEGHEAGGHNGKDELTTMVLTPQAKKLVSIPLVAAGGISTGQGIMASLALGADGVQMGSRFVLTKESSAHENFKRLIQKAGPTDTTLCMKQTVPVRLLHNKFFQEITAIEQSALGPKEKQEKIIKHLGKGRAKLGMLDGNTEEGELEIGQVSGLLNDCPTVSELFDQLNREFQEVKKVLLS
jgi:enoyl-[acyl-carrier protein] reductase II